MIYHKRKKNNEVLNKVNPYDSHVYGSTVFSPGLGM